MAAIRSKNTKPELALREALRTVGATGYRVHLRSLPGRPDVAFTRWKVAAFVDGAFWHGHPDHFDAAAASEYWRTKIARNQQRDAAANESLAAAGWVIVRCWDFEVKENVAQACDRVIDALRAAGWQPPPGKADSLRQSH
jgi:DNA mismatch endonuclease (patch repair protein)